MQSTHAMKHRVRDLQRVTTGIPATDGDGVRMTRVIASPEVPMLDPFLLFDVFESERASDYIGGFPDHPHRGFETVTYLLAGRMRHRDSAGHEGVIEPGGVQWMTAGSGIIHSEMPEQQDGLLQGFQLWVNLPARDKMQTPAYQEFAAADIPERVLDNGTRVRVIAGSTDDGCRGPVRNDYVRPLFLDVHLPAGQTFQQSTASDDNAFIFVVDGGLQVGTSERKLQRREMGILQPGDVLRVHAEITTRFLLISAQPLNEPVARGGPFVMNTREQVLQAFEDYQNNRLVEK